VCAWMCVHFYVHMCGRVWVWLWVWMYVWCGGVIGTHFSQTVAQAEPLDGERMEAFRNLVIGICIGKTFS
jgi:hypothetical protein